MEELQKELERRAFNDILTHKYFIHGTCMECGGEYSRCTNRKSSDKDLFCSDKCKRKNNKKRDIRNKEIHHYQVFKDDKFYYIIVDSIFHTKRDFNGKTWMKKSQQEKEREEDGWKRLNNWKQPILTEKSSIPKEAIKIIDKNSAFLYDKKDKFGNWKNLRGLI